jgi:plastocyanin
MRGRRFDSDGSFSKRVLYTCITVVILLGLAIAFTHSNVASAAGYSGDPVSVHVTIVLGSGSNTSSLGYSPDVVHVVIGINNTVVWTNNDTVPHTVTSVAGGIPSGAQAFNSGNLNPGQSWNYTFTQPGTYEYHCIYHFWMKGTVIVESSSGNFSETQASTIAQSYSPSSTVQLYTSGGASGPNNPPGYLIAAGVFVLVIAGLFLGEVSARKTRKTN